MAFPKYVYKRGTAKKLDDNGLFTAEAAHVKSQEELEALGPGWCESPAEAGLPESKAQDSQRAAVKPAVKVK